MTGTAAERAWTGGRPLRGGLLGDLRWRRPGLFRRELILEAGSEVLAQLRWERWFSFEAHARSADGHWIIARRRTASLRGDHVVREAGSDAEVATFRRGWRGTGVARFAAGPEYRWEREGLWHPRYRWAGAGDTPLLTFRTAPGFAGGYAMTVDPSARSLAEVPVLVLLGGYVMAMITAQSAAT